MSQIDQLARPLAGRIGTAAVLGLCYRRSRSHPALPEPAGAARTAVATGLALAAPALTVAGAARYGRWRRPGATDAAVLGAWTVTGAIIEEIVWRAPLALFDRGLARVLLTTASVVGFVGLHLRRDGLAAARVHVPNTVAWTFAATTSRRVAPALVAHVAYNLAAQCLYARPQGTPS